VQKPGSQAIVFVKNSEKDMFRTDVFDSESLRFLRGFVQDAFAFSADRNFNSRG
jgi:hypothetical protein